MHRRLLTPCSLTGSLDSVSLSKPAGLHLPLPLGLEAADERFFFFFAEGLCPRQPLRGCDVGSAPPSLGSDVKATPPHLRHWPGSLSRERWRTSGSHPLPSHRLFPSPVRRPRPDPLQGDGPGPECGLACLGTPAMGCIGSRSPAGQGKRQRPVLGSLAAAGGGGCGPLGRGGLRRGPVLGEGGACTGEAGRQEEGAARAGRGLN